MNPPPNAALYYVPAGYTTTGPHLMGINAASEGLLRAMVRHAGVDRLYAVAEHPDAEAIFDQTVRAIDPTKSTEWIPTAYPHRLSALGTLLLPGPGLSAYAWMRRRASARAYSLCGVTHTTATPTVLDALADLLVAPVQPWDAVICTSNAVQQMVASVLDDQAAYLKERFGTLPVIRPHLPVIPLGVNCEAFIPDPARRTAWRQRLGLRDVDIGVLFVGRLSFHSKAHPIPFFLALEAVARTLPHRLSLILAGWFPTSEVEQAYFQAMRQYCPSVTTHFLDGRQPDVRRSIWSAADLFLSPVDNIQETFGLTPIEAMAAGLPVIVSDWNGYRDTVRHGIDGFRIPTMAPPPGACEDLEWRYACRVDDYDHHIGAVSQNVVVDIESLTTALTILATDPDRRRMMGAAGQLRARTHFEWSVVIARYQELWTALAQQRHQAPPSAPHPLTMPTRPDPFRAFASYPTQFLEGAMMVRARPTMTHTIRALLASPMINFVAPTLPSAEELEALLAQVTQAPTLAATLVAAAPPERQTFARRGLLWLAKYGFVAIAPPPPKATSPEAPKPETDEGTAP